MVSIDVTMLFHIKNSILVFVKKYFMDNNQFEMIEKDKKSLKKLWGFLVFFVLLMIFLLYFRVYLGLGDKVRTIVGAIVLVFLIANTIVLIVKVKRKIDKESKDGSEDFVSTNQDKKD